jgi:hypothetical protein
MGQDALENGKYNAMKFKKGTFNVKIFPKK